MNKSILIRILVADDHPVVRKGLAAIIDRELDMTIVGQAGDGYEAIEIFREKQPDVVLMDLRMPKLSGVAAIKIICGESENAGIIVLTTYDNDENIYRGIKAGAKGCLFKDTEPDQLLEAIRTVAYGKQYISPVVAGKLKERKNQPQLSDRELETLQLIAKGKSNQEIATILHITEGTVKFHVNNILAKLQVRDRTQAVLTVMNRGILDFR
ncbi:MAG: response regulator transcription factor [Methylacidiphilales bacterium]|nr:response regulator transcription factor [Candidatus Methylacidiphilales bacterium]NJR18437.1 response regulator transcription factor [Calothrix sp. CSU_2_0]